MIAYIVLAVCMLSAVSAFGAGNIPTYGALEGNAFRHGDIEDILLELIMNPVAHGAAGLLSSLNPLSSSGKKFSSMDVKRVYFGNFLRDYSQAIDVGTLSKGIDAKSIKLLVWVMSFLAFGYATEEFEVTEARLGVYRPEEHIDNPKGYPSPEEHDARKYDARLRGPIDARELQIDPHTGMKNYIANEQGGWMTSAAYIRNSLLRCIELGREHRQSGSQPAKFESFRILGQALHTLEDFPAHSNYVELALIELGHRDVFAQVGLETRVNLQGRQVYPLTTGTFGGLDFVHSLLGEATDKISQTQISDVSSGLATSSAQGSSGLLSTLQNLTSNIPGSSSLSREIDDMQAVSNEADSLRTQDFSRANSASSLDADEIARKIYPIMAFRDRMMKGISAFFEKIPGLSELIDRISQTLTVWVLSTIEPFMKPVVEKITGGLGAGQALVTSKSDQLAVFENPRCSDPTHSMLAKDHFSCYLNKPAGLCAQAIVRHVVSRVTAAWADASINPAGMIVEILEVLHHPASASGRTPIQAEMRNIVKHWYDNLGQKRNTILEGLTFAGVKEGRHHEGGSIATTGVSANHTHSHGSSASSQYSRQPNNGYGQFDMSADRRDQKVTSMYDTSDAGTHRHNTHGGYAARDAATWTAPIQSQPHNDSQSQGEHRPGSNAYLARDRPVPAFGLGHGSDYSNSNTQSNQEQRSNYQPSYQQQPAGQAYYSQGQDWQAQSQGLGSSYQNQYEQANYGRSDTQPEQFNSFDNNPSIQSQYSLPNAERQQFNDQPYGQQYGQARYDARDERQTRYHQ